MKHWKQKGTVCGFGLALALASGQCALAEDAQPLAFATPESAMAVAVSPAAFARVAGESKVAAPTTSLDVSSLEVSSSSLPDAPQPVPFTSLTGYTMPAEYGQQPSGCHESHYTKYIPAGCTADKLTVHDKLIVGARDLYSFSNFAAMFASAGYAHVTNGQPNYGTNREAFAKRLGAAAIRETSEGVFTDMVFSPIFHQDTRYYEKGPRYGFFHRTLYAVTRPLVTRTDNGNETVNAALLAGYAASAALNVAYYPQSNRNFRDVASSYGGSIGGAALGFFVTEFTDDVLEAVHLKK